MKPTSFSYADYEKATLDRDRARLDCAVAERNHMNTLERFLEAQEQIEALQAENISLRADRDQWKLAAELSRDGIQPMLRMQIEARERELAEYRTAEEQGLLIRLPCEVGGDIYWINDEEKCVSVHKNGIRGIVVRNG